MNRIATVLLLALPLTAAEAPATAAKPAGCAGSATLGTFQLSLRPFSQGAPLPLKSVTAIRAGARLIWNPVHLPPQASARAEVTAVIVPEASDGILITLEPRKAGKRTEWQLLQRPQVIALVYGPQGLSEGKVKSLVTRDQDLLRQLADYAEQSSQVESLVQEISDAQQSGASSDSLLKGVSTEYGVSPQKLTAAANSNQQAALLLKALIPASNTYDPLGTQSAQVQQSGGLAASVAGLFFGNPVGLASGGAALLQNLKTVIFPNTEFRSAFAQSAEKDGLALCTKNPTAKSKTRTAYLWAYRVPQLTRPEISLTGTTHLPLGSKSTIELKFGKGATAKELPSARDWRLMLAAGGASIPVDAKPSATGALEIDLSKAKLSAGDYQLAATWDWDPLPVGGTLHLHPYGDLAHATLASGAHDKLIEGSGTVAVELSGADFEFLEKVAIESTARDAKASELAFTLPSGKRAGPQNSVTVNIDTAKQGPYLLLLTQSDGVAHKLPVTVLPPNPKISDLPIRLNMGETREPIRLLGSGLERIEAVSSDAGEISGVPDSESWSGEIRLKTGLTKGQGLPLVLKVQGFENPLIVPHAIQIVGPRPRIRSVQKSLAGALGIELAPDELPAGTAAGLALAVDQLHDSTRQRLELGCEAGELRKSLTLSAGEPSGGASLTSAGPGALYLSVDPGAVGYAGCRLSATVMEDPEGRSDPFILGRVIRVPTLDKFTLTAEKVGDSNYAGVLEGRDLDVIEKAGWDAANGVPVESIPTPLPGDAVRQTLRLVLPWPAPGPHAPLYVWLRGEPRGRKTAVAY
jgi:hypothetical protein